MPSGPGIALPITTDDRAIAGAKVVAGYGGEPWLPIRDLTKLAKTTARDDAADDDRFDVIGVTGSVTMTAARSRSLLAWSPSRTTSMFQPPGVR